MKLYTRDQMIQAFNYGKKLEGFDWIGDMIDSLTPIELPSDEEIRIMSLPTNVGNSYSSEYIKGFNYGAKWVIKQIKQQDNA